MTAAIQFVDVNIIFGLTSKKSDQAKANKIIADSKRGMSRAEIIAANNAVIGVNSANLTVEEGSISVLMGLSGSGKTTLLRGVNGLNKVTQGQILIKHKDQQVDVVQADKTLLRDIRTHTISMVFQQFGLLPWKTVRENVSLGLELRGMKQSAYKELIDAKLELVGLKEWGNRLVGELSGGMQQRVGLARALATDADILLMDEPFSALDPLIRTKLQDELISLQRHLKKTILFVSHDLDEALKIGNQISIMEGGRIVQTGRPEDIVLRPKDAYVAEFVQHMNPLNALMASSVMMPLEQIDRRDDGFVFNCTMDYKFTLDRSNKLKTIEVEQKPLAFAMMETLNPAEITPGMVIGLPATTLLKHVLDAQQISNNPTFIHDEGRIIGVCRVKDILAAISGVSRKS